MNLNDFVVIPNKAKSVKLNARRNMQELRMETVTLAQESEEMEERLQRLRESMIREKMERGRSGGLRWKSGQAGALANNSSAKKNKENGLKLHHKTDRIKIRMLKDESMTAPVPPASQPTFGQGTGRKQRLRGRICGQCEVTTAGLVCPECGEDYCIGCFAKFHQKGALKLHRMIPIQAELQTSVSTLDVVSSFCKEVRPSIGPGSLAHTEAATSGQYLQHPPKPVLNSNSSGLADGEPNSQSKFKTFSGHHQPSLEPVTMVTVRRRGQSPVLTRNAGPFFTQQHTEQSQVLMVNYAGAVKGDDEEREAVEREWEDGAEALSGALLCGEYDEEESAQSFQEALSEWRSGEGDNTRRRGDGNVGRKCMEDLPVTMSAIGTQAELPPIKGIQGEGGGVPIKVVFNDNSLCYLDRLLLKKHRRTPIETYRPKSDLAPTHTQTEETDRSLTEEEDFRRYYASLFAVSTTMTSSKPLDILPASSLVIEVLDERRNNITGVVGSEPICSKTFPSHTFSFNKESMSGPRVNQAPVGSSGPNAFTSHLPEPSEHSGTSAEPKGLQQYQDLLPTAQLSTKLFSKIKPSPCPTSGSPWTTKTSNRKSASTLQRSGNSGSFHKSQPDVSSEPLSSAASSALFHLETSTSSLSHPALSPRSLGIRRSSKPDHPPSSPASLISPSLRSTFTLSPFSSISTTLLPEVSRSPPLPGRKSTLLQRQASSLRVSAESTCPQTPSWSVANHTAPPHPPCLSSVDLQPPPSPRFHASFHAPILLSSLRRSPHSPERQAKSTTPPAWRSAQTVLPQSSADSEACFMAASAPPAEDPMILCPSEFGGHNSTPSYQDLQCLCNVLPNHNNDRQRDRCLIRTEEERSVAVRDDYLTDTEDEMSTDSLGLTQYDEDSSDEEMKMDGLDRYGSTVEDILNDSVSMLEDSQDGGLNFDGWTVDKRVNASTTSCKDSQLPDVATDPPRLQPQPSRALQALAQKAGSVHEQYCSLDGLLTLGSDLTYSYNSPPEYSKPWQEDSPQLGPHTYTGAVIWKPSSSLKACAQEHLVRTVVKDSTRHPTGIQHCPATPTLRSDVSSSKPRSSGSHCTLTRRSTPVHGHLSPSDSSQPSSSLALRQMPRVTQEILDICSMDQAGCEDRDQDTDADTRALSCLEQELRLMVKETSTQALLMSGEKKEAQCEQKNAAFTWGRVGEEEKEEEEDIWRDQQSVLSLP